MNYKLSEKKALSRKVEATHRPLNVEIVLKRGTLVMTFTPAAYEIYKYEIFKYYEQHPQKTFTIHKKTSETKCDKSQHFRISMFNTQSKMDVNGRLYQTFIANDLPEIIRNVKMDNVENINKKIFEVCESIIRNIDCETKQNGTRAT